VSVGPEDALEAVVAAAHARDAQLSKAERRRRGVVHTPPAVARFVAREVDSALRGLGLRGLGDERVALIDPACGPGIFLAACLAEAGEGAPGAALGLDVDARALGAAEALLGPSFGRRGWPLSLRHGDTLSGPPPPLEGRVPVVIGNPPWAGRSANRDAAYTEGLLDDFRRDAEGAPLGRELHAARAHLGREEVELPEEARALAQLRFERPGIWGQICPHRIANLRAELGAELGAGDDARAAGTCREILELDEGQAGTRAALVGALARLGQRERAESELSQLVGPPSAAPPVVQEARKQLADALWRRDRTEEAGAIYRALLEEPMSDDDRRQIAVRLLGLEMGGAGEAALRGLLVPRRDAQSDAATAMHFVARLSRVREDGLAPYLEARQLQFRQRFDLALPLIERARERGLPSPLLETEARRMEAMIRFGADDLDGSAAVWRAILADPASDTGERAEAEDWLQRVVWARAR